MCSCTGMNNASASMVMKFSWYTIRAASAMSTIVTFAASTIAPVPAICLSFPTWPSTLTAHPPSLVLPVLHGCWRHNHQDGHQELDRKNILSWTTIKCKKNKSIVYYIIRKASMIKSNRMRWHTRGFWQGFSKCFSTSFYRSPSKHLTKNVFQPEAMEKPFCNLYYRCEAKNNGFPQLLPHMWHENTEKPQPQPFCQTL
jgi:hypothetical protein